jgi:hypothetical protein
MQLNEYLMDQRKMGQNQKIEGLRETWLLSHGRDRYRSCHRRGIVMSAEPKV